MIIDVQGAFPEAPIAAEYRIESMGTVALGPMYGRVKIADLNLLEAEATVKEKLLENLTDVDVQITLAEKAPIDQSPKAMLLPELPQASANSQPSNPYAKLATPIDPPTLLYDGKTFEQWQNQWKTELKVDNRVECIKALVAFGRAGRGEEATKAIFEVAREYNYFSGFDDSEGISNLRKAVVSALNDYGGLPAVDWLPLLTERLEQEPEQWSYLASQVLSSIQKHTPEIDQRLKSIAKAPPAGVWEIQAAALQSLLGADHWHEDSEIVALVHEA